MNIEELTETELNILLDEQEKLLEEVEDLHNNKFLITEKINSLPSESILNYYRMKLIERLEIIKEQENERVYK